MNYQVEGDNASVSLLGITNEPDQSILDISVKWMSDDTYADGTVYIIDRESFQSTISGTGQLVLNHQDWISSGAAVISLFDNADRPIWRPITTTFETDSIFWEPVSLSGDQDNASAKVKVYYTGGTIPSTLRTHLVVSGTDFGQLVPDADGYLEWENLNLPDNQLNVELLFENAYDYRSDKVINCKRLEGIAAYVENTTVAFVVNDNQPTIYYGDTGSFTGTLISQASYINLKLQENLYHENGALVDNIQPLELTPGASVDYSLSHAPLQIVDYTLRVYSASGTLMWEEPVCLNVKLRQPASASPADLYGTTDNVLVLRWNNVNGADNYVLQYTTDENFDTYQELVLTENQYMTPELAENRWYWRVRAQGENLASADWLTRSAWVDRTLPSLDSFSGPSSTSSTSVTLSLAASDNLGEVYQVRFKEGAGEWGAWQSYATSKGFTLSGGDGTKTVYAQVRDRAGNESNIRSTSITLSTPTEPTPTTTTTTTTTTETHETDPPTLVLLTSIPAEVTQSSLKVQMAVADASAIGNIEVLLDNSAVSCTFLNDIITVTLFGLQDGPHTLVFRVADEYGTQTELTIGFTVKLPPTPVPVEENENIAESTENISSEAERLRVENVEAGENVKFTFAAEITAITLVPNENVREMILTVVKHDNFPSPPFDNTQRPYRYFKVELHVAGTDNYSGALADLRFEFKVERTWIENENITNVRLYRLVDNSWEAMSTRFVREDFDYRYYEAVVPGLSLFSIVGARAPVVTVPVSVPVAVGELPFAAIAGIVIVLGGSFGGVVAWLYKRPKKAVKSIHRTRSRS